MNTLKKLQFYMGKRKVLMPIALTLSGLSGLLSLMPFIFIWLIVRSLLLTGSVASGIPINVYAWWAVGTAVAGLVIYFAGLMLLHLAAFRVETNMRRTAMRKIMQMPLGFFDRNTSGQMRKIIDENASETHTFVAHLLPDLAGSFIAPLSVIILIFVFNWQLGLACLRLQVSCRKDLCRNIPTHNSGTCGGVVLMKSTTPMYCHRIHLFSKR